LIIVSQTNTVTIEPQCIQKCPTCFECLEPIKIIVTYSAIENPNECGEYFVDANFEFESGEECASITRKRWVNGADYAEVRSGQTFHFHSAGSLNLEFTVITKCGDSYHYSYNVPIPPSSGECSGCGNTFSICDFQDAGYNGPYHIQPKVWGIFFYTNDVIVHVDNNNNYGCFHFPYYLYVADECGLPADVNDMVFDINKFLDLAQTGNSEYEDYFGHATMQYYNDPGMCKQYIKFEDCGVYAMYFDVDQFEYDQYECKFLTNFGHTSIWYDPTFTCSTDCIDYIPPNVHLCDNQGNFIFENNSDSSDNALQDLKDQFSLKCIPSIIKTSVDIEIENANEFPKNIDIIDINGKIIASYILREYEYIKKINFSTFVDGIYFIRVTDLGTGEFDVQRVLKQ
jgi:hypothetical protein